MSTWTTRAGLNALATVRSLSSTRKGDDGPPTLPPPYNSTREYISKNPELRKLLADLYDDYDDNADKEKEQQQSGKGELAWRR